MSGQFAEKDAPLICQLCGREGASVTAGIGDVVGVPVHIECWMDLPESNTPPAARGGA